MRPVVALGVLAVFGCNDFESAPVQKSTVQPAPVETSALGPERPKGREPEAIKVDLSLGDGLEMRRPLNDGRVTLIPIIVTRELPVTQPQYITLQDGMAKGVVSVRELGHDWEVDTVRVSNKSKLPLLVMAGELIEDANQDRVTAENTVIMAGETRTMQVRCVEEDRDHGGLTFHASFAMAELGLRQRVIHATQDDVWEHVKVINKRDGFTPRTNTYRLAAHAQVKGASLARRDKVMAALSALEERQRIVGLAVAIDGKVVAIDRFATPELYRMEEPMLLAAYLPATDGASEETKKVSPANVRELAKSAGGMSTEASFSVLARL